MNQLPKISVIIPVYNTAPYLRACLDSVIHQHYSNLEIICVNDGSSDESSSILESYLSKDARLKIVNQTNKGLPEARNAALDIATGEWILGLDSDDSLKDGVFSVLVKNATNDVDIVWYGVDVITPDSAHFLLHNSDYKGKCKVSEKVILSTNVHFGGKMWRRSFLDKLGVRFIPGLWYEDAYMFYASAPFARCIYFETQSYYNYFVRTDSIMGLSRAKNKKGVDHMYIAEALFKWFRVNPIPKSFSDGQPSRYEVTIFSRYFQRAMQTTPRECYDKILNLADKLGDEFSFYSAFPRETAFMRQRSKVLAALFYKCKPSSIRYKFFGVPVATRIWNEKGSWLNILGVKFGCSF